MDWCSNILATAYGCRNASEKGTHDHGEGDPENQLRDKRSLDIPRPEARLRKSRRQSVVVRTPISPDGEKREDDHGNSGRVAVGEQRL